MISVDSATRLPVRVKMSLRDTLLAGAVELLTERGFHKLRMSDVAATAGVSRQTVYNEFGGKETLAHAVALSRAHAYLDGVGAVLAASDDPVAGVKAAVRHTLDRTVEDPLLTSILTGINAAALFPFLNAPDRVTLRAAVELISKHLRQQLPRMPPSATVFYGESIVRLTLSHLLLPSSSPAEAADSVTAIAATLLAPHLSAHAQRRRPTRGPARPGGSRAAQLGGASN